MSEVSKQFNIDEEDEFRFELVLKSRSVNAHSLMDNNDNKEKLKDILRHPILGMGSIQSELRAMMREWKEKHK